MRKNDPLDTFREVFSKFTRGKIENAYFKYKRVHIQLVCTIEYSEDPFLLSQNNY